MTWRSALGVAVFAALWNMGSEGVCDSLSEQAYPLLNIFDVHAGNARPEHRLNLWQSGRRRQIVFSFRREDLYRKYLRDVLVTGISSWNLLTTVSLPVKIGRAHHSLELQVSGGTSRYDGRTHDQGWLGEAGASGIAPHLKYILDVGRHRVGVSISRSRSGGHDQRFTIQKFPNSETDRRMNQYLLDLLEPTFGRDIIYNLQNGVWDVEAGGVLALSDRSRLGADIRLQRRKTNIEIEYTNTGSKTELQGLRRMDMPLKWNADRFVLSFEQRVRQRWRLRGKVGYTTGRLNLTLTPRDVPTSSRGVLLDFVELGDGSGSRKGVDLKLRGFWDRSERFRLDLLAGWGRSTYRGEGEGTTPVLGFRFGALPISHRGDADLSGTITSWVGGVQARKNWERFRLNAGGTLARSKVTSRTRADAHLEFGLYVHPVRDTSRHWITLFRFHAAPSVQISRALRLMYQATQHVIVVRGEVEKVKVEGEKLRGGTIHTVTMAYLF